MIGNFRFPRRIRNLSYAPEKEVLSITFHTGKTQEYCNFPSSAYQRLESSSDQDEFYDEKIYGNYQISQHNRSKDTDETLTKVYHR
jgi:hypothetical protein